MLSPAIVSNGHPSLVHVCCKPLRVVHVWLLKIHIYHVYLSVLLWSKPALGVQAIRRKLAGYPERAKQNMHHARCRIPATVAHVLHQEPLLVAPAVEAFYARDAAGMKAASRMQHFPPQVSQLASQAWYFGRAKLKNKTLLFHSQPQKFSNI